MALSFREIVRNDEQLLNLLGFVDRYERVNECSVINVSDVIGICAKITKINTTKPTSHSRRIAWTVTGRLLIGLTTYLDFQAQICFEESRRLMESCGRRLFVVERTKTTKRKIKQVTKQSINKKRRTVETEIEEEDVEQVRFWEEPLQYDQNFEWQTDSCLGLADQITLRESIEPPNVDSFHEMDDSFGDIDEDEDSFYNGDGDEDEGMYSFSMALSQHTNSRSHTFDENMNDVLPMDTHPECDSMVNEVLPLQKRGPKLSKGENESEKMPNIFDRLPPLKPSVNRTVQKTGKRRSSVFMDDDLSIPIAVIKKRVTNVFVNCKKHDKVPFQTNTRTKPADMFSRPAMSGILNREVFAQHATYRSEDTDYEIMKEVFATDDRTTSNERNESVASVEVGILRSEHSSQRRLRSSLNVSEKVPPISSTPLRPSQTPSRQNIRCSTPMSPRFFMSPPSNFQQLNLGSPISLSHLLVPPVNFDDDHQSNYELHYSQNPASVVSQRSEQYVSMADQNGADHVERPELIKVFGKDSREYVILSKLADLWQKKIHPIKVENLLPPRSNRLEAAKTFASLLVLKKKNLIQLENDDDGKIGHISKGPELNLDEVK